MHAFQIFAVVIVLVSIANGQFLNVCQQTCKSGCNLADSACGLLPGFTDQCVANKAACDGLCDLACNCADGCLNRCQGDADQCNAAKEGNLINPILCFGVQNVCIQTCGPSCGFDVISTSFNAVLSLMKPPATVN